MSNTKELQVKEKQEVTTSAEYTKPGVVFTPAVDIFETDRAITLLADMPGVRPKGMTIDLKDGILTLSGEVQPSPKASESNILFEFETGEYYRQFTLSDTIAQERIEAKLEDGTLRLILPKAEKAIPRQITVTAD